MTRIPKTLFFILCVLAISSCKQEGCIDPDALNYNIVADDDDGSCKYCSDSQPTQLGYSDFNLIDNRNWSPYFNQTIAKLEIYQREIDFNYSECGQSSCYIDMNVENVIDENISLLQFNITLQTVDGFSYGINQWQSLNIDVGKDTLVQNIIVAFPPQECSPIIGTSGVFGNVNSAEFN